MTIKDIKNTMKENTQVYYVDQNTLNIIKCRIKAYSDASSTLCLILTSECDTEIYASADEIFLNIDDANALLKCAKEFKVSQYCREINTVDDLSRFPYMHELYELDYNNPEDLCILEAYAKRIKELLKIEI